MNYQDLVVWQRAMESNIEEGHKRKSTKEYARFLSIAMGSKAELETQFQICVKIGYLVSSNTTNAISILQEIGKMINVIIKKLTPNL